MSSIHQQLANNWILLAIVIAVIGLVIFSIEEKTQPSSVRKGYANSILISFWTIVVFGACYQALKDTTFIANLAAYVAGNYIMFWESEQWPRLLKYSKSLVIVLAIALVLVSGIYISLFSIVSGMLLPLVIYKIFEKLFEADPA